MTDASSVRIKVAQYFVNKNIQELEDNDPKIKIGDLKFLQALPHYEPVDDVTTQPATELDLGADSDEASHLPPLFPAPQDGRVSWKSLLQDGMNRWTPPDDPSQIPPYWPIYPPWYKVAIIGAGVAGLRTAKLLQDMGIPYKIFEAGDRPGGRIFTYQFSPKTAPGKHDYYDVGAMRFPDNDANKRTFKLFKELGLSNKMIEYVMSRDDNIRFYNSKCSICIMQTWAYRSRILYRYQNHSSGCEYGWRPLQRRDCACAAFIFATPRADQTQGAERVFK